MLWRTTGDTCTAQIQYPKTASKWAIPRAAERLVAGRAIQHGTVVRRQPTAYVSLQRTPSAPETPALSRPDPPFGAPRAPREAAATPSGTPADSWEAIRGAANREGAHQAEG